MALTDIAIAVKRVYVDRDYSYPMGLSINMKRVVAGVLSNLMGEARQDGRLKLAKELDGRLKAYHKRLEAEVKALKEQPKPTALFTKSDMDTHPVDDNYGI